MINHFLSFGMNATALTGDPDPCFMFKGKVNKYAPFDGNLSKFLRPSKIGMLCSLRSFMCESSVFPRFWASRKTETESIVGVSVPISLIFFFARYVAASSDRPGKSFKYSPFLGVLILSYCVIHLLSHPY